MSETSQPGPPPRPAVPDIGWGKFLADPDREKKQAYLESLSERDLMKSAGAGDSVIEMEMQRRLLGAIQSLTGEITELRKITKQAADKSEEAATESKKTGRRLLFATWVIVVLTMAVVALTVVLAIDAGRSSPQRVVVRIAPSAAPVKTAPAVKPSAEPEAPSQRRVGSPG